MKRCDPRRFVALQDYNDHIAEISAKLVAIMDSLFEKVLSKVREAVQSIITFISHSVTVPTLAGIQRVQTFICTNFSNLTTKNMFHLELNDLRKILYNVIYFV